MAIARFANAAEAGYFAYELLTLEDVDTEVRPKEHFDALAGLWRTQFLLTVPAESAESAAAALQALVADSSDQPGPDESRNAADAGFHDVEPAFATVDSGVNWVPIVLTLAAGSAVLLGWNYLQQGRPARVAPAGEGRVDFWESVSTSDGPWTQPVRGGRGLRQLIIQPRQRIAELREDADGDGVFESATRIPLPQP